MAIDVICELEIQRPRAEVAAYAADPDNTTSWYANIKAVEWETPRPLTVGTRLAFIASFLGRRLSYTYEIREFEPGEPPTSSRPGAASSTARIPVRIAGWSSTTTARTRRGAAVVVSCSIVDRLPLTREARHGCQRPS